MCSLCAAAGPPENDSPAAACSSGLWAPMLFTVQWGALWVEGDRQGGDRCLETAVGLLHGADRKRLGRHNVTARSALRDGATRGPPRYPRRTAHWQHLNPMPPHGKG